MDNIEEKLNWIFTAFDADGGGSIDPEEITEIVRWMFRFAGIEEDPDLLASCVIDVRKLNKTVSVPMITTKNSIVNHFLLIRMNKTKIEMPLILMIMKVIMIIFHKMSILGLHSMGCFQKVMSQFLFNVYSRATVDQDGDGDISKEEFIKNSMNSPFIAEVLKDRKKKNRT